MALGDGDRGGEQASGGGAEEGRAQEHEGVARVFEAWRSRQASPERIKLGADRRRLIEQRLRLYEPGALVALIRYAYEADAPGPRFWRGDNDKGQEYLGLDNLFRSSKIADRVDAALAWSEGGAVRGPSTVRRSGPGAPLLAEEEMISPIGALRAASRAGAR